MKSYRAELGFSLLANLHSEEKDMRIDGETGYSN